MLLVLNKNRSTGKPVESYIVFKLDLSTLWLEIDHCCWEELFCIIQSFSAPFIWSPNLRTNRKKARKTKKGAYTREKKVHISEKRSTFTSLLEMWIFMLLTFNIKGRISNALKTWFNPPNKQTKQGAFELPQPINTPSPSQVLIISKLFVNQGPSRISSLLN